jgi:arsenate reductase-like glutaredoxin family protein
LLEQVGAGQVEERELGARPLSTEELDLLIGQNDYKLFLNSRNELYRERNMKERPPARAEALKLMAAEQNLIKRPLLVRSGEIVYGFDTDAWKAFLGKRR